MQHTLCRSVALAGTAALSLSAVPGFSAPAKVAQANAADLGVMEVSLKDAVQFNWGFQGQTQGAGTPNEIGIGGFLPLAVGANSLFFLDAAANVNLADIGDYSSIVKTEVAGTTISTSTRLGYRWLTGSRSWMFGVNAGYDSRPMATGGSDNGLAVKGSQTVFFQQVAAGIEAASNSWNLNAYASVPIGEVNYRLNSVYGGGSLYTYGIDAAYSFTPELRVSLGSYYQFGDCGCVNDVGVRGRIAYAIANGLTIGANLSYDPSFESRVSGDLKYRFGSNGYGSPSTRRPRSSMLPVVQALSATPANRDVRVHDGLPEGEPNPEVPQEKKDSVTPKLFPES